MLDFETFCQIFYFFVRSEMDENYVNAVDDELSLENGDAQRLVEQVKEFHQMRSELCRQIMAHLKRGSLTEEILGSFCCASGVEHYSCAPLGSTCAVSGIDLTPDNGCLIVVDRQMPYTIDKRLKTMVFNLWYLVHLPSELTLDVFQWLSNHPHWESGRTHLPIAIEQIQNHEDNHFAKRAYVKLTSVCRYIQSEMADIPINSKTM